MYFFIKYTYFFKINFLKLAQIISEEHFYYKIINLWLFLDQVSQILSQGCFLQSKIYYYYVFFAVRLSGILKGKQKPGVIFNSDKLGSIDFTNFQN